MCAMLAGGALTLGAWSVGATEGEHCASWPGEIAPLPSTTDADPFAARWARLRFDELVTLAAALSERDPTSSRLLWEHARCLSPRDDRSVAALAGLVPRPEVLEPPVIARPQPRVRPRPEVRPRPRPETIEAIDAAIAEAAQALLRARFRSVLDVAVRARELLGAVRDRPEGRQRLAQLEIIASTAELALDREADAVRSLKRALVADPGLELDESVPRKVRRLLLAIREGEGEVEGEVGTATP